MQKNINHKFQLGIQTEQNQKPIMTPQLQQAISILQFSTPQLVEYIADQVQSNPLLEYSDEHSADYNAEPNSEYNSEYNSGNEHRQTHRNETSAVDEQCPRTIGDNKVIAHAAGTQLSETGLGHSSNKRYEGRTRFDGDYYDALENIANKPTLHSHLSEQIELEINDPQERIIAYRLLDLLDTGGRIGQEWKELASTLGVSEDTIETVLLKMQTFDPPGILARDLRECLRNQLVEEDLLNSDIECVLNNLEALANLSEAKFCRLTGLDSQKIGDIVKIIRSLNPKPASLFNHSAAYEITPDLLLARDHSGQWVLELHSQAYPPVRINSIYSPDSAQGSLGFDSKSKRYVAENYAAAKWLIRTISQRAETILKVGEEIVRQQGAFFEYGVNHLKPMVLRDIANATDLHESTVSRVINGKYLSCERGTFELKYFFTAALLSRHGGSVVSALAVRDRIKAMIEGETAKHILSDSTIADILMEEGIDIARRTVAKYREAMGIPSSVRRRKVRNSTLATM